MTSPHRTYTAGALVVATVALIIATFAGAAAANTAHPPGNNGTVDIHSLATSAGDRRNQPHPGCQFLVTGFGFDANQHVNFTITGHGGPNAGPGSLSGVITMNESGAFQIGPLS